MTDKTSIWSISLNVLLNQYESSTVRTQACAFLTNLINFINYDTEKNSSESFTITVNELKCLLDEIDFYKKIGYILSTFYPFETYTFTELVEQNRQSSNFLILLFYYLIFFGLKIKLSKTLLKIFSYFFK